MHRAFPHRFRSTASCAFAAIVLAPPAVLAGVDPVPLWTGHGNQANANLGYSVAAAGDVNGDGFTDLIIGARGYDSGQADEGRAYLYLGSASGPEPVAVWSAESDQLLAFLGSSVASAGDVDGDGYADVLVGAPSYDGAALNGGRVYLYRGAPAGPAAAPDQIIDGTQASATFGCCVARAGDVNGDGYDDVIIGARGWDGAEMNAGRAVVHHGGPAGLDSLPSWTLDGTQDNEALGWSVAGAGDVNGDGYADVIVGAFFHDGALDDEGAAWIYPGSATGVESTPIWFARGGQAGATFGWSVAGAGDVNGDGYADVVVGARYFDGALSNEGRAFVFLGAASGMDSTAARTADGGQANAYFGWSVASAGDVNGDGFADVVVGAYQADVQWLDDGEARIYLGGPAGTAAEPAWTASSLQQGAAFGWSVAGAGDVDGDGFGDVVVGAHFHDDGQDNEGAAMLFRGGAEAPSAASWWKGSGGPAAVSYGFAVGFVGDVNGDGYTDVLVADPLADVVSAGEGRADVFFGAALGPDTSPAWSTGGSQAGESWGRAACGAGDVDGDGYDDVLVGAPYRTQAFAQEGRAALFPGSTAGLAPFAAREWLGNATGAE
ncbi:integrin alpha, partial [bacterium]|nr:integrin alpha [bacterium]